MCGLTEADPTGLEQVISFPGLVSPRTMSRGFEARKGRHAVDGFKLDLPFEDDPLMVVLTFGVFPDVFGLPDLN